MGWDMCGAIIEDNMARDKARTVEDERSSQGTVPWFRQITIT